MKRIAVSVLLIVAVLFISSVALAETRASNYFSDYGISLSAAGNGKVNFTMNCSSHGVASQLGVSNFSVQKYTSSGWVTVASGDSDYQYGVSSYALSKSFNGVAGEKYRVKCTFLCTKSDSTSETKTSTSPAVLAN